MALADFVSLQNVREAANLAMQLLISQCPFLTRLPFPQNGGLVAAVGGQMSIQAVLGKIEFSANKTFRKRSFPLQYFSSSLLLVKLLRLSCSDIFRLLTRWV